VDSSGNAYVAGYSSATWGSPLRAYSSGDDAYTAKLDSSGNLTWNTFLGGSGTDQNWYGGIAVDSTSVYVSGFSSATWGSPLRGYTASAEDGFVVKLDNGSSSGGQARVAGEFTPVNRLAVIAPWLLAALVLMAGSSFLVLKFRRGR
jgi:hypothetical protein